MIHDAETDTDGVEQADETGRFVRPYAITGGRTGSETEISLEMHIQATDRAAELLGGYRWEAAEVIHLTQSPMALIEIAARLKVPIGVAKVLVSDLVADGALRLHVPIAKNYASLLERVLDGVRNI